MSDPADARLVDGRLTAALARIGYAGFLGLAIREHEGRAAIVMPFDPRLIGAPHPPILHGGTLAALLEITAQATVAALGEDAAPLPRPVNVTVNYLRPGRPRDTLARAQIVRAGGRVVSVEAWAWQDAPATPIATLSGHFAKPPL